MLLIRLGLLCHRSQIGLVSVYAKFQLSSWPRSALKVWGGQWGGMEHVATVSNLNPSYLELL